MRIIKLQNKKSKTGLSSRLHDLEPLRHQLRNLLVLVLQQPQRERDIAPLPLRLASGEPRRELLGELLGVLVLFF